MAGTPTRAVENILIATPENCWRAWVQAIAADPDMTKKRALAHLRKHVGGHLDPKRFEEWLAGCYNLLAILSSMYGMDPKHIVGADLLYRKWLSDPTNHTPPPKKQTKKVRRASSYSSGS